MTKKPFELEDMAYVICVELIGKVQGAYKAAVYFSTIPTEFQSLMVYSILLKAYVGQKCKKYERFYAHWLAHAGARLSQEHAHVRVCVCVQKCGGEGFGFVRYMCVYGNLCAKMQTR